jgi:hypothetical protein
MKVDGLPDSLNEMAPVRNRSHFYFCLDPLGIVEADIRMDCILKLLPGTGLELVDQLGLKMAEKTLHARIVPAVALPGHALDRVVAAQQIAIAWRGIVAPLIAMDQDRIRPPERKSFLERS